MKIRFLGTGTSTGIPEIGCRCSVCTSKDPRDKRTRSSIRIDVNNRMFLIDCGPDFYQQVIELPFQKIDAVLLTHEHYDHVGGLDDLRPFGKFGTINLYAEQRVCETIKERMPYCFSEKKYPGSPNIQLHTLPLKKTIIHSVSVIPIRLIHGQLPVLGFRIGEMAYLTDLTKIPEEEFQKLKNIKTLIIAALREEPHLSHQTLSEALKQIERIKPEKAYLIHMSHQFGLHSEKQKTLPPNVFLAYDGLEIEV